MAKNIYLIRHGQTDFNLQGIVQGGSVDTDLNETGHAQSELFFNKYRHIPFDKIYTSALKRSQQSVKQFINLPIPHEAMAGLNEISWGAMDGKIANAANNDVYWDMVKSWAAGNVNAKIPSGESPLDVQDRLKPALETIMARNLENNILICMHGRAMRILLATILEKDLRAMDEFEHNNLCLYLLTYEQEKFSVVKANDTSHLE